MRRLRAIPGLPAAVLLAALLAGVASHPPAHAGEADVLEVQVQCEESVCVFAVTVRHADSGWQHYADRWEILGESGEVLATRVLAHPHVGEQPFTRRLPGVALAGELEKVRIRAHDSVHGYGGAELEVAIPPRPVRPGSR